MYLFKYKIIVKSKNTLTYTGGQNSDTYLSIFNLTNYVRLVYFAT